jgi:hypothetical protein
VADESRQPGNYLVWTWGGLCKVQTSNAGRCVAPAADVIPQPTGLVNPGPGDIPPGAGPSYTGTFENSGISDVPSNYDYSFRAGIFAGDYESVAVDSKRAHTLMTDARNGRSSGGPAGGGTFPSQPGRNPACEQADVFYDSWGADNEPHGQNTPGATDSLFLVTPCPADTGD